MPTAPSKLAIKRATAIIDTLPEWMRDEEALHDLILAMVTARIAEEEEYDLMLETVTDRIIEEALHDLASETATARIAEEAEQRKQ